MKNAIVSVLGAMLLLSVAGGASQGKAETPSAPSTDSYGVPAGFSSRFATANGVRLHYVIGGKGPAVLLIHGWPEGWLEWAKTMPLLAQNRTVIAVDMRGFGASEIAPSGYDKRTLAEDLYQLMTQLGYNKALVVGHDWGGPVAYAYAAAHRDAVEKLVIAEGTPKGPWTRKEVLPLLNNPLWFFGFFEIPDFAERVVAGHEKEFMDWFYRTKTFHVVDGAFSEADIAYYEAVFSEPGRLGATLKLYRTIDQDIIDNEKQAATPLTIPVLAIGARHGLGPAVINAARQVASNVTPVLMEDTGHFLADERPAACVALIEAFDRGETVAPAWRPAKASAD